MVASLDVGTPESIKPLATSVQDSQAPAGAEFKCLGFVTKAQASEPCFGHTENRSSDPETSGIILERPTNYIPNVENCN